MSPHLCWCQILTLQTFISQNNRLMKCCKWTKPWLIYVYLVTLLECYSNNKLKKSVTYNYYDTVYQNTQWHRRTEDDIWTHDIWLFFTLFCPKKLGRDWLSLEYIWYPSMWVIQCLICNATFLTYKYLAFSVSLHLFLK